MEAGDAMNTTQIKGRAHIHVEQRLAPKDMDIPRYGAVAFNLVEVEPLFEQWKAHLALPEKYTIVGVFFDLLSQHWIIALEGDDIPLPDENNMAPMFIATFQQMKDDKIAIVDLRLIE